MLISRVCLALVIGMIFLTSTVAAETSVDVKSLLDKHKIVGAVYVIFDKDRTIETRSFGYANLAQKRLMTTSTNMRLASLSKVVTTTAIMQLRERGLLKLDSNISQYLGYKVINPHYPDKAITIQQLLTHTSSISDFGGYGELAEYNPGLLINTPLCNLLSFEKRALPGSWYREKTFLDKEPGQYFMYSNLGFIILGSIVERVSGMNFRDYCRINIFEPLGMQASFDPADVDWKNTATLYSYDKSGVFRPSKSNYEAAPRSIKTNLPLGNAASYGPQGGLMCNLPDYAKFMGMLANGGSYNGVKVLLKSSCDYMQQLHWFSPTDVAENNATAGYWQEGLDLQVTDSLVKNQRMIGHGGDAYGLRAGAFFNLVTGKGFVMAFTGGNYQPNKFARGFSTAETEVAQALNDKYGGFAATHPVTVTATNGYRAVMVDYRRIILPGKLVVVDDTVPEITLNDVLGIPIKSLDFSSGKITLIYRNKKITFERGKDYAISEISGRISLEKPVAIRDGHFYLPLNVVRTCFDLKIQIIGNL